MEKSLYFGNTYDIIYSKTRTPKLPLNRSFLHQSSKTVWRRKYQSPYTQNSTQQHTDTVTPFEFTSHAGVTIRIWPHITVRIIDTVATGLCFVSKKKKKCLFYRLLTSKEIHNASLCARRARPETPHCPQVLSALAMYSIPLFRVFHFY